MVTPGTDAGRAYRQLTERPILFSGPMVRAILSGRKTVTRRLAGLSSLIVVGGILLDPLLEHHRRLALERCKYGLPGDRLWVRETWHPDTGPTIYAADYDGSKEQAGVERWRPSIHMPRSESRITLEITGVTIERLQDVNEEDAAAEGLGEPPFCTLVEMFAELWDGLNGKRASWSSNPWVWALRFRRITP